MTTSQPASSSKPSFGYTKAGRPRKRPLPNQREGICPVKECQRSFTHRLNPKQAVWQHLGYYLSPLHAFFPTSEAHIQMHEQMKAESASMRLSENEKKERQKESKKKWVEKN
ncbi:hypothetical protein C7212DRAFT_303807, partial [Tuber magnatum]